LSLFLLMLGCQGDVAGSSLVIAASTTEGPLPLTVTFSATGTDPQEAVWDLGDGTTAEGEQVTHTYLASGGFSVKVRRAGSGEVENQGPIEVLPGVCPDGDGELITGQIEDLVINEASGLMASRMNPGVLWTHNDSGDDPRFYAIDDAGTLLAIVNLLDVSRGDWEDMALAINPETDAWQLVAGNVGDNDHDNDDAHVHFIDEPQVLLGQELEVLEIPALTIDLTYPDGQMLDSESIMVDPVTQDLYLVTKDYAGPADVYRKSPPHEHDTTTELELVTAFDFSSSPLSGSATTGADWSPLGDQAVIRTYNNYVYLWRRDQAEPVEAMWATEPCEIRMPFERQSESIAFDVDGGGLWSLSEGEQQPLNFVVFAE
jgi:hypothetical protein